MNKMKKVALLNSLVLAISTVASPLVTQAEESTEAAAVEVKLADHDYTVQYIEAEGDQVKLGYTVDTILEVDGLKFKDMNGNGELDTYEDWRVDTEDRITDLISQMTMEEKTKMFYHVCTCGDSSGVDFSDIRMLWAEDIFDTGEESTGPAGSEKTSMYYYITVYGVTHFLDNSNGTPQEQISYHNDMQTMGELTRLGIPITISSDREYNGWGGMIDAAHDANGTANDVELSEQLWTQYSKETRAVGYHILLHPYSHELGSWNGEDPSYTGEMSKAEIEAIQVEGGAYACAKHFIGRGGDDSFSSSQSVAENSENWLYSWSVALEGDPQWVMTNGYSTGLYDGVHVDYDEETMSYLRDTLGFDGVLLSDWGDQGADNSSGTTADGTVLDDLTIPERYAYTINLGLDQIGSPATGYDVENPGYTSDLGAVYEAVEQGLITEERVDETVRRVLRTKFNLGLFENPYSSVEEALALAASDEYIAEQWEITDMDTLQSARNQEVVELERQLEAESAVLVKNDDDLLPLSEGINVYFDSTAAAATKTAIAEAIGEYATVVEDMDSADVVVADCTQLNDAAELTIDDAKAAGKKLVIVSNCVDPDAYVMENGDAVLFMNFSRTADHGTGADGFITTTEPCVYAELLFGVREPEGMIVKEIARDSTQEDSQWKDLAGDMGANDYVRLILQATMLSSEDYSTPNNYGDPLLCYQYGMRYGESADFVYDTLIVPQASREVEEEDSNGDTVTSTQIYNGVKDGETFTVYTLLWNNGEDGVTNVEAYDGDTLIAQKQMAVCGGSWRVVQMDLVLNGTGEHTITVGDLTATITVE